MLVVVILALGVLVFWLCTRPVQPSTPSLYERLGGIYGIALVVNDFSDALIHNPVVGQESPNPQLKAWSIDSLNRLPGLKWMRTLWVAAQAGGPYRYIPTKTGACPVHPMQNPDNLHAAHLPFHITSNEFDAVAKELQRSMTKFNVSSDDQQQVLAVFAKHKTEVVDGTIKSDGKETMCCV